MERLARDKNSCLFVPFVSYEEKCFITLDPGVKALKQFYFALILWTLATLSNTWLAIST
jgi:hypothetical protein